MKLGTKKWELKDIIMMGIIGVVFAAIYLASTSIWVALQTALTPTGYATLAVDVIYGIWFMAGSLAAFIIRKPGTAFVSEFLAGIIEMLMGNFGGPLVVLFGAIQGLGNEVGFAIFRYKKFGLPAMCASAIFAAIFSFVAEILSGTILILDPPIIIAKLVIRLISSIIFTGVISYLVGKALVRTGVLKSYPAGADMKAAKVIDD